MARQLRYYQVEAKEAVEKALKKGIVNQLLVMATGTGKTATSVDIIKDKGRVLWGTHTEDLLEQSAIDYVAERANINKQELSDFVDQQGGLLSILKTRTQGLFSHPWLDEIINTVGIVKAELFIIDKPIVFASMQTLWNRLDKIPANYFDVVVCDECHLFGSKTFLKSINHFTPKLRLGLTATPHRMDGMLMGDIFDEIVYEYPIEKAIKDGFLCEIDAIRVKTQSSLDGVKTLGGELNQGQLEEVINTPMRNDLIVEKYLQYCPGKQFIAFCVDVQHAMDLTEVFKSKGVNTEFVVGDKELTTDRRGILQRFKQREITGISNVMILTAGFDHPNTGAILMCCPTKSLTKFLQQIGRGTRLKDEEYVAKFGQKVTILDFIDVTSKHRLINTWGLDKEKEIEDRVFVTQEKKDKLIQARIERTFKAEQLQKDVKIDLLKLPKVKISDSIRMQEPASEAQLNWIKQMDYDVVNINYTKAMCAEIIGNSLVPAWKVKQLASAGYDVSKGVTQNEYQQAIKDIHARDAKANTERLKQQNKFPFKDLK